MHSFLYHGCILSFGNMLQSCHNYATLVEKYRNICGNRWVVAHPSICHGVHVLPRATGVPAPPFQYNSFAAFSQGGEGTVPRKDRFLGWLFAGCQRVCVCGCLIYPNHGMLRGATAFLRRPRSIFLSSWQGIGAGLHCPGTPPCKAKKWPFSLLGENGLSHV